MTATPKLTKSVRDWVVIGGSSAAVVVALWISFPWAGAVFAFLAILTAMNARRLGRSMRFSRFLLGSLTGVVGIAALSWAVLIWVGTSLDKETYPAGLIIQISAACFIGLALLLAAVHLARGSVED